MATSKGILISKEDLDFLLEGQDRDLSVFINNCYCAQCDSKHDQTITDYTIWLNHLYDIILDGYCKNCGHTMGRYIELGENPQFAERAKALLGTRQALKEAKVKAPQPQQPNIPTKGDKKILRQLIEKGLQKEYVKGIERLETVILQWRQGAADNRETYHQLYDTMRKVDKHIAFRYDGMRGSDYLLIVAVQFSEGLLEEADLEGLSEGSRQRVISLKRFREEG
jgi:hypothetical protein